MVMMGISSNKLLTLALLLFALCVMQISADFRTCPSSRSPCFLKKIPCPAQCPSITPTDPKAKVYYLDRDSPICKAECKSHKPNCNGRDSACLDPRFVGANGIAFYFYGRRNKHFSLVFDVNLQINARLNQQIIIAFGPGSINGNGRALDGHRRRDLVG